MHKFWPLFNFIKKTFTTCNFNNRIFLFLMYVKYSFKQKLIIKISIFYTYVLHLV